MNRPENDRNREALATLAGLPAERRVPHPPAVQRIGETEVIVRWEMAGESGDLSVFKLRVEPRTPGASPTDGFIEATLRFKPAFSSSISEFSDQSLLDTIDLSTVCEGVLQRNDAVIQELSGELETALAADRNPGTLSKLAPYLPHLVILFGTAAFIYMGLVVFIY